MDNSPIEVWTTNIKKPYQVDVEAYKFMFSQAKERFEDYKQTSETITKRAFQIIFLFVAILGSIIGYYFSDTGMIHLESWHYAVLLISGVLFVIAVSKAILLLMPKSVMFRGSPPSELFIEESFIGIEKEYSEQTVYYLELCRLETKIRHMKKANGDGIDSYRIILVLSFLIIICFVILASSLA